MANYVQTLRAQVAALSLLQPRYDAALAESR
jgi:hypothetical protein